MLILCLLFLLFSVSAFASKPPVLISADLIKGSVNSKLEAKGNVEVEFKDVVIKGDYGLYDRSKGLLRVWGKVLIKEGGALLHCKNLVYNLKTKRAVLEGVSGFITPTDRIKASLIERLSEKEWIAYDGEYTPCSHACPDWSVKAKKFKILLGESFEGKWVSFRVKEIPIFVSPYLSGPIVSKRRSGFLFPKFGYVSKDGFVYKQPFYLVLGRSADLTLTYEKRSINGQGKRANFRYVLSPYSRGSIDYYQLNKKERRDWSLEFNHSYFPSDFLYGKVKGQLVSSRAYYKDSTGLIESSKVYTKSDITLSKLWKHAILNVNSVYLRYLDGSTDTIYQRLPEVNFYLLDTPLFNLPLFFNFYSQASYFYRKAGGSSYRIRLSPSLKCVKKLGVFKNTSELLYRYTYYQLGAPVKQVGFKNYLKLTKFVSLGNYSVSLNPELDFSYLQGSSFSSHPNYDITDSYREEKSLTSLLEFYLYSSRGRLGRLTLSSDYLVKSKSWNKFISDLELSPFNWLLLKETALFSLKSGSLSFLNSYLKLTKEGYSLWLNHYQSPVNKITYLKWGFSLPLNRFLSFNYSQRYDLKFSQDRERSYSFTVNRGCWSGRFSYRWVKNYDNTITYQYMITVNLLKLGSYGYKFVGKRD